MHFRSVKIIVSVAVLILLPFLPLLPETLNVSLFLYLCKFDGDPECLGGTVQRFTLLEKT